jgi:hypothetical protein
VGIRETLNQNQGITTGVTIGIVVIALIIIIWQLSGGRGYTFPTRAFYTVDDGQTTFVDAIDRIPPFDHQGQEAVRVHMFSCDGGRTRFVGYLERYNPQAKARMEQARAAEGQEMMMDMMYDELAMTGVEYRKPGMPAGQWVNHMQHPQIAGEVTSVRCPDGTYENLRPVLP